MKSNKKIVFFDKNINRKSDIVKKSLQYFKNTNIPMPSVIEISILVYVIESVPFVPEVTPEWIEKFDNTEFIKKELHEKICKELKEMYRGIVVYSGFNEPLLNKKCYENIARTREYLPNAKIELITNGDVLNLKRLIKLFNSGLSTILISVYDGPEDEEKFKKLVLDAGLNEKQYVIRNRYLPPEEDFGITISNRSGLMDNAEHKISSLETALKEPCFYPSYSFFIDYNGDVLMCSHDWGKKYTRNLNSSSIYEIWTSQNAENSRKNLYNAKRNFSPCNVCDVKEV